MASVFFTAHSHNPAQGASTITAKGKKACRTGMTVCLTALLAFACIWSAATAHAAETENISACTAYGSQLADLERGILSSTAPDAQSLKEALAACTAAGREKPDSAEIQFFQGLLAGYSADHVTARQHLEKAALQIPLARVALARLLLDGKGGPADQKRAHQLLNAPDTAELPAARLLLAATYWKEGGPENSAAALQLWQAAASHGAAEACVALGRIYLNGAEQAGIQADARRAEQYFHNAAQLGHVTAMVQYLYLLEDRAGRTPDFYSWLKRAADAGNAWAMTEQAYVLAYGDNGPARPEEAFALISRAAEQNSPHARLALADFLRRGVGIAPAPEKAFPIFVECAEQGDDWAQLNAGLMLFYGEGVPANEKRAFFWIFKSVEQGNEDALEWMGKRLIDLSQTAHEEAIWAWGVPMLEKWAQSGQTKARYYAAATLLGHWPKPEQEIKGLAGLRKLAEEGYAPAMLALAHAYASGGKSFAPDTVQARRWAEKALELNFPGARSQLAGILFFSPVSQQDQARAVQLWQEAVQQENDPVAAYMAGEAYYKGLGIRPNPAQAVQYLRMAARNGWHEALYSLGWLYFYGAPGFSASPQEALAANRELTARYENLPLSRERLKLVDSLMQAGLFHTLLSDFDAAEKSLQRALAETDPLLDLGLHARALIGGQLLSLYLQPDVTGKAWKPEQAERTYAAMQPLLQKLLAEDPANADLLLPYADALAQSGDLKRALEVLDTARSTLAALPPPHPANLLTLAAEVDSLAGHIVFLENPRSALEYLRHADELFGQSGQPRSICGIRALSELGVAGLLAADTPTAIETAKEHVATAQSLTSAVGLATHPVFLEHAAAASQVLLQHGQTAEARAMSSRVLAACGPHLDALLTQTSKDSATGPHADMELRTRIENALRVLTAPVPNAASTASISPDHSAPPAGQTADGKTVTPAELESFIAVQMLASLAGAAENRSFITASPALSAAYDKMRQRRAVLENDLARINRVIFSGVRRAVNANGPDMRTLSDCASALEQEIAALHHRMRVEEPEIFRFTTLSPLSLHEARAMLQPGEAFVVFAFGAKNGYAAALSAESFKAVQLPSLSAGEIQKTVSELRSSILPPRQKDGGDAAPALDSLPQPDCARAHGLYVRLFDLLEPVLGESRHIFVMSGPELGGYPLAALPTALPPREDDHTNADPAQPVSTTASGLRPFSGTAWLGKRWSLSILPSIQSLQGIRDGLARSDGPEPGMFNPHTHASSRARAFFLSGKAVVPISGWAALPAAAAELDARIEKFAPQPAPEALRRAMTALIDQTSLPDYMAHPAAWAVYTMYGDNRRLAQPTQPVQPEQAIGR